MGTAVLCGGDYVSLRFPLLMPIWMSDTVKVKALAELLGRLPTFLRWRQEGREAAEGAERVLRESFMGVGE